METSRRKFDSINIELSHACHWTSQGKVTLLTKETNSVFQKRISLRSLSNRIASGEKFCNLKDLVKNDGKSEKWENQGRLCYFYKKRGDHWIGLQIRNIFSGRFPAGIVSVNSCKLTFTRNRRGKRK